MYPTASGPPPPGLWYYLPIHLSTYLAIYLSTYLAIYPSTYLSIYLSTYIPSPEIHAKSLEMEAKIGPKRPLGGALGGSKRPLGGVLGGSKRPLGGVMGGLGGQDQLKNQKGEELGL